MSQNRRSEKKAWPKMVPWFAWHRASVRGRGPCAVTARLAARLLQCLQRECAVWGGGHLPHPVSRGDVQRNSASVSHTPKHGSATVHRTRALRLKPALECCNVPSGNIQRAAVPAAVYTFASLPQPPSPSPTTWGQRQDPITRGGHWLLYGPGALRPVNHRTRTPTRPPGGCEDTDVSVAQ